MILMSPPYQLFGRGRVDDCFLPDAHRDGAVLGIDQRLVGEREAGGVERFLAGSDSCFIDRRSLDANQGMW
jgi:hypothetical protein